eukprot:CAMPEP_0115172196 /NCGR_PEP_ID=MMETSP0270-20121206/2691_1 /TAXON_ID=71861 /ORGANISM="Scrippsiella trochoidea, Strain CCMP3099" /LENGTH=196 /DNA_ID=CAMNT_0002584981 /DNA_START=401 /DNA_END=988 /DNA_ORIENTATION=-
MPLLERAPQLNTPEKVPALQRDDWDHADDKDPSEGLRRLHDATEVLEALLHRGAQLQVLAMMHPLLRLGTIFGERMLGVAIAAQPAHQREEYPRAKMRRNSRMAQQVAPAKTANQALVAVLRTDVTAQRNKQSETDAEQEKGVVVRNNHHLHLKDAIDHCQKRQDHRQAEHPSSQGGQATILNLQPIAGSNRPLSA